MKYINYLLGIALLLLANSCVQGDGMVSGTGESYRVRADLESKGKVNGLYDKGTQMFTLTVSWTDLFVSGEDAVTGIKIYKGSQKNNPIRTLKSSNNNPTNENGMNFVLASYLGLTLEEEQALINNQLYLAITTTDHIDGVAIGQLVCNEYDGKDSYRIENIGLQDNASTFFIAKGSTEKLPVLVVPYYADNAVLKYESLNTDVFTITADGVVTGLKPGVEQVRVSTQDGTNIVKTFTVQVTSPETTISIEFMKADNLFVVRGEEPLQLEWVVLPITAVNKEVKFSSSDETLATVDADGKVTGLSSGIVTITATAKDGAGATGTCQVKVYGTHVELDRSAWTATASTQQNGNEAPRTIDGNPSTLWHNRWSPASALPQSLTIDMGVVTRLSQIEIDRRNDANLVDVNSLEVYVGDNPDTAPLVGSYVFGDSSNKEITARISFEPTSVRYMKVVFTKSNRGSNVSVAELRAYLIE